MSIADELEKLQQLRSSGALTEAEFESAKYRLLHDNPESPQPHPQQLPTISGMFSDSPDNSLGRAANRFVSYQAVAGIVGLILFIVFAIVMFGQMDKAMPDPSTPFPGSITCTSPDFSDC